MKNIALIIGSVRKDSINRHYANAIVAELNKIDSEMKVTEVQIGDLPLYNQDFDEQTIDSYEQVLSKSAAPTVSLSLRPNTTAP